MATGGSSIVRSGMSAAGRMPHLDETLLSTVHQRSNAGVAFEELRAEAYAALMTAPFPQPHEEWWRYTRAEQFPWGTLTGTGAVTFRMIDFSTRQIVTQPGLTVASTAEELSRYKAILGEVLAVPTRGGQIHGGDYPALAQLSLASGVVVVEVAPGVTIDRPLVLEQNCGTGSPAATPVIVFLVGAGARATIVEAQPVLDGAGSFVCARVEIRAGSNSHFQFASVQDLARSANYFGRHRVRAEGDSRVQLMYGAIGCALARVDLEVELVAPGAQVDMISATLADGRRHLDFHPVQNHLAPQCGSNLYAKAVVKDQARSVYAGFIKVAEGAQKTDAYQKNRNLLLSSDARADSIPNLEIKANDVKCSHGASVGQIGEDEMFYLLSRGLTRQQAEKLLVEAFFEDLFASVTDPALHEYLSASFLRALQK